MQLVRLFLSVLHNTSHHTSKYSRHRQTRLHAHVRMPHEIAVHSAKPGLLLEDCTECCCERPVCQSFADLLAPWCMYTTQVQITLDGYSAPVSAGNFAANVLDGIYNGR